MITQSQSFDVENLFVNASLTRQFWGTLNLITPPKLGAQGSF